MVKNHVSFISEDNFTLIPHITSHTTYFKLKKDKHIKDLQELRLDLNEKMKLYI